MGEIRLAVTMSRMPHTTEFFRVVKSLEHTYYALLFATETTYEERPRRWRRWIDQGFSAAIRNAPPDVEEQDRIHTTVRSDKRLVEVVGVSENDTVLAKVAHVLSLIDAQRRTNITTEAEPTDQLIADLFHPVQESLAASALEPTDTATILEVLNRGMKSLLYPDVTSIDIQLGIPA